MEDSIYKDEGYQEEPTEPDNKFQPTTEPWTRPQTGGVLQKVTSNLNSLMSPRPGGGPSQLFAGGHKCNSTPFAPTSPLLNPPNEPSMQQMDSSPVQDLHPQIALPSTPEAGEERQ